MTFTNRLPLVVSCCFCCFLRAGTIMIALFSLSIGLLFAPNVAAVEGFWNLTLMTSHYSELIEAIIHLTIGWMSIFMCFISLSLLFGALFNATSLIHIYIYGIIVYSSVTCLLFFILSMFCIFIHGKCNTAGVIVMALIFSGMCLTFYFILVTNSLRVSIIYLKANNIV